MSPSLVLASASARRRKIVAALDRPFEVLVPDVAERLYPFDPRRTAAENARAKHDWARTAREDASILAADTVIDFEGACVGKPRDSAEAARQLLAFSGKPHSVLTAAAFSAPGGPVHERLTVSVVRFRALSPTDVEAYLSLVHPLDKAGSYDIDQYPELIIESFSGSRTNIMGLPRAVVKEWLALH